jgi:hypothetical protein
MNDSDDFGPLYIALVIVVMAVVAAGLGALPVAVITWLAGYGPGVGAAIGAGAAAAAFLGFLVHEIWRGTR